MGLVRGPAGCGASWEAHNHFMSAWSSDTPAVSGWYWVQYQPPEPVPDLVWVEVDGARDVYMNYEGPDEELFPAREFGVILGRTLWVAR